MNHIRRVGQLDFSVLVLEMISHVCESHIKDKNVRGAFKCFSSNFMQMRSIPLALAAKRKKKRSKHTQAFRLSAVSGQCYKC